MKEENLTEEELKSINDLDGLQKLVKENDRKFTGLFRNAKIKYTEKQKY